MSEDTYGRHWSYRAFSERWTEPDVRESGRRYLRMRPHSGGKYVIGLNPDQATALRAIGVG